MTNSGEYGRYSGDIEDPLWRGPAVGGPLCGEELCSEDGLLLYVWQSSPGTLELIDGVDHARELGLASSVISAAGPWILDAAIWGRYWYRAGKFRYLDLQSRRVADHGIDFLRREPPKGW